jgi:hypothetical protein
VLTFSAQKNLGSIHTRTRLVSVLGAFVLTWSVIEHKALSWLLPGSDWTRQSALHKWLSATLDGLGILFFLGSLFFATICLLQAFIDSNVSGNRRGFWIDLCFVAVLYFYLALS